MSTCAVLATINNDISSLMTGRPPIAEMALIRYVIPAVHDDRLLLACVVDVRDHISTWRVLVTFRRIPSAGHNLAPEGRPVPEAQQEYDAFMTWFERR